MDMSIRKLAVISVALVCLGAKATVIVDFSNGAPAGSAVLGKTLLVGPYQFAGNNTAPSVTRLGAAFAGYGLAGPLLGSTTTLSVSRADGKLFALTEIDTFVGGTLVTGPADFELVPFDSNGLELNPVVFYAGQFATRFTVSETSLSNLSSFRISSSLVDHFTLFSFASVADVPAVPEPAAAWLWLAGGLYLALRVAGSPARCCA